MNPFKVGDRVCRVSNFHDKCTLIPNTVYTVRESSQYYIKLAERYKNSCWDPACFRKETECDFYKEQQELKNNQELMEVLKTRERLIEI